MAFDVCVYTKGGIVQFVKVRPEILINAERFSAWAELPSYERRSWFLGGSRCNARALFGVKPNDYFTLCEYITASNGFKGHGRFFCAYD